MPDDPARKALRGAPRDWPAAVGKFRRQLDRVSALAAERQRVFTTIARLDGREQQLAQAAKAFNAATTTCATLLAQQPFLDAGTGGGASGLAEPFLSAVRSG
jgi:hypothetical protein